jgi:hypothetical protein
VTVRVDELPPVTLVGLTVKEASRAGSRVRSALLTSIAARDGHKSGRRDEGPSLRLRSVSASLSRPIVRPEPSARECPRSSNRRRWPRAALAPCDPLRLSA